MKYFLAVLLIAAIPSPAQTLDAQQLEGDLRVSPEDLSLRQRLMETYKAQNDTRSLAPHIFWTIEHHAESGLAGSVLMQLPAGTEEYDRAKQLWQDQVSRNASGPVLRNAAAFFDADPVYALDLLKQAHPLAPEDRDLSLALARAYGRALTPEQNESVQRLLKDELAASDDPVLVGGVARILLNRPGRVDTPENDFAMFLMNRAKQLEPDIERQLTPGSKPRIPVAPAVQAKKLKEAPSPEYPGNAHASHAEVRFQVVIGADGNVLRADVMSGHPLFVDPAKAALLRYRYERTLLNGKPVEVLTTVDISFTRLP